MTLDTTFALSFTTISYVLLMVVALLMYRKINQVVPHYKWFIVSFALNGLGYFSLLHWFGLGMLTSLVFGAILILIGNVILLQIISIYYHQKIPMYFIGLLLVSFSLVLLTFTYLNLNTNVALLTFFTTNLVVFGALFRTIHRHPIEGDRTLLIAVGLYVLTFVGLSLIHVFFPEQHVSILQYTNDVIGLAMIGVAAFLSLFGLIQLHQAELTEQVHHEMEEVSLLEAMFYQAPLPIVVVTKQGDVRRCNKIFHQKFCGKDDVPDNEKRLDLLLNESDRNKLFDLIEQTTLDDSIQVVKAHLTFQQIQYLFEVTCQIVTYDNDVLFMLFFNDLSQQEDASQTINQYNLMFNQIRYLSKIGMWRYYPEEHYFTADRRSRDIYEIVDSPKRLDGAAIQAMVDPNLRPMMDNALRDLIQDNKPYDVQFQITTKSGKIKQIHSVAFLDTDKNTNVVIGTLQDITAYVETRKEINQLRTMDELTNVMNSNYFHEQMYRIVEEANLPISIIVTDLDNLSLINQTFGYDVGNDILRSTAQTFFDSISSDALIGRIGDDEFAMVLPHTTAKDCDVLMSTLETDVQKNYSILTKKAVSWTYGTATMGSIFDSIEGVFSEAVSNLEKNKSYYNQRKQMQSIDAIMTTLNEKDPYTDLHSTRVAYYAKKLAVAIKLNKHQISLIETAALLHDIGKILIDNAILLSTNSLSDEEYDTIKKHPIFSYNILSTIKEMKDVSTIVLAHHERIDGQGYPYQIKGTSIPFESKIIAIADAYDAMTGKRRYRQSYLKEEAILELLEHRDTQFDAELVNTFIDEVLLKENT